MGLLLYLSALSDVRALNATAAYDHARQTFVRGDLQESQEEAEQAYRRFLWFNLASARKFQLLEAEAMAARGLNEDVLRLFADDGKPWDVADQRVQMLAIKGRALSHLHRLEEAKQQLNAADLLCDHKCSSYGWVLRAKGMYAVDRGDMADATSAITESLGASRATHDAMLEGYDLLTLGFISSQQERHDAALEYYRQSDRKATDLGAKDLGQWALGDQGWEQYQLGNLDRALELYKQAEKQAFVIGNKGAEINWLETQAKVYADLGTPLLAEKTDLQAFNLARLINKKQDVIDSSMDLAQVYIRLGRPDDADRYANVALEMAQSPLDVENVYLITGQAAMLRGDWARAKRLLDEVSTAPDSQTSMRWEAEQSLANLLEAQGDAAGADKAYRAALALVELARSELTQEELRLTFLAKATRIYDDYIHFLVAQGKPEEALEAADWSRARTLQQGLGMIPEGATSGPPKFNAIDIARKSNATLLFYWLGERQSYLWAAGAGKMVMVPLPKASEIAPVIERYRQALLDLKDPLRESNNSGNKDGRTLYETLVAPAANLIAPGGRVVILADGPMSQINFETFIAASPSPHYWIEDATLLSAPSIRLFAAAKPAVRVGGKLLLLGDSISPGPDYPDLPMAALEMEKVRSHLPAFNSVAFARERATPAAYLKSDPEQFSYIHFVTHGTANSVDPMDSAVILSRMGAAEDSYKLYARDILLHPIHADLVTISACNSSGTRAVAGEGLVGLSWAFLRAGAHNAIGSLWEVGDASTPQLMDRMYAGLAQGQQPAEALRAAKLAQVHSEDRFHKPFYWAPFQLYAGR